MTSPSYANTLRQFEEIEEHDSELVRLPFGHVIGTTPERPVPLSTKQPLTEPSTENSDGNSCRLCSGLESKAEKFDTLQLKRKHARMHFYQQRCFEPTVDFRDVLKRCFIEMSDNSVDKSDGADPSPPMADPLSNDGRGEKRQNDAGQMASTSGPVENKRRKVDQSAPCEASKKQELCAKDLADGKQLRQIVYELLSDNLKNNTNAIKCRLCQFEVNLQSPVEDGNEDDVTVLVKFNRESECMRLLEHAFEHIGRILEYPCPLCDYMTDQCQAIQDHIPRMHGVSSINCNAGKLPCDDDSLSALRRCFADSGDDNATKTGIKDGSTSVNPDVAIKDNSNPQRGPVLNEGTVPNEKQTPMPEEQQTGDESNRKGRGRQRSFDNFLRQYCDGFDKRVVSADGQVRCRLCTKNIKAGSPKRIHLPNLFGHALRHLWRQLYNRPYPQINCWMGMEKHPRETGEMMLACYGVVEEPKEGGD